MLLLHMFFFHPGTTEHALYITFRTGNIWYFSVLYNFERLKIFKNI